MKYGLEILSFKKRVFRHILFWLSWVLGFTLIKSFGASFEVYFSWLVYYLITLPLFVGHTYLVVYWAGSRFLKGKRIFLFILLFLALLIIFSGLELLIINTTLSKWFPAVFDTAENVFTIGNIFISGIGNLYILLVFIAARMVRSWALGEEVKDRLLRKGFETELADANAGIQPGFLLFSIGMIEKMAGEASDLVPDSITRVSDLLNDIMISKQLPLIRVDEELKMIQKLKVLYAGFFDIENPRIGVDSPQTDSLQIRAFMIFSPLEVIMRYCKSIPDRAVNIEMYGEELVNEVKIKWPVSEGCKPPKDASFIDEEIEKLFPLVYSFEVLYDNNMLEVCIRTQKD